jgi:4-hydroxy-2-oxoglutarate aldolase
LSGVFPPIATPFDDRGEVDPVAIRANVPRWLNAGVRGIVALGSNGEAPLLADDESDLVIASVREVVPKDRLLIAGTGRESTRAAVAASRRAADLGADAVLVRTPSYFKSRMTPDAFIAHYTAIADAVPVPVLLYNYPAVTGLTLTSDTVGRLAEHPNIVGMKETTTDVAQMGAYISAARGQRFDLLAGSAPGFYASLCIGAAGAILAAVCVVPRACVALFDAFTRGDHSMARDLQQRINPINAAVTSAFGVPGLKAALDLTGFVGGAPRLPLLPPDRQTVDKLRDLLAPLADFLS